MRQQQRNITYYVGTEDLCSTAAAAVALDAPAYMSLYVPAWTASLYPCGCFCVSTAGAAVLVSVLGLVGFGVSTHRATELVSDVGHLGRLGSLPRFSVSTSASQGSAGARGRNAARGQMLGGASGVQGQQEQMQISSGTSSLCSSPSPPPGCGQCMTMLCNIHMISCTLSGMLRCGIMRDVVDLKLGVQVREWGVSAGAADGGHRHWGRASERAATSAGTSADGGALW